MKECDLGQQSILHAVKIRHIEQKQDHLGVNDSEGSRPMNETLVDWQLTAKERKNLKTEEGKGLHSSSSSISFTYFPYEHLGINFCNSRAGAQKSPLFCLLPFPLQENADR